MTLKAFKAALREGMQIAVTDHWIERYRNTVRTITKLQGNGYFFTQEGDPKRHWAVMPKASQLQFDGRMARIQIADDKHWLLHLTPNGIVDHDRWERSRGRENECDGERRMAEQAQEHGADMTTWYNEWLERSAEWREEIGHEVEDMLTLESAPEL